MEVARAEDATRMGDYVVLKRVAVGGMAEIFLARHQSVNSFERLVVLKRILPEFAHHDDFVRMFLNEARIAATLHHNNIVQVHSIGEEHGQVFFAMEFLHGEDLSHVLSRANQLGRAPQLDGVLTIVSAVCSGLHYAHERTGADGQPLGIVHRDVSPHNVFVTYDGNIKLLDFGIAKAATSFGKTRTGVLKGKVAYMSPEQAYSQPVDRRSDIFCMGILLWELSTGRRLYRRRSELETLKALVDEDAPRPSTVVSGYPAELETIVMKCLERDRDKRYATCDELSQALEKFAASQMLQVSPLIATRMMRTLFRSEIQSFEAAVKSGTNLVDQVISRMEETQRKASFDDWDSNVPSMIVDMSQDPDWTAMSNGPPLPDGPTHIEALQGPVIENETTDVMAPPRSPHELPLEPRPTPQPLRRASTPAPRAQTPPPDPPPRAPTPIPQLPMPPKVADGVVVRSDPTEKNRRADFTQKIAPAELPSFVEGVRKKRSPWPIMIAAGVIGIAIAIIAIKTMGGTTAPEPIEAKSVPATPAANPEPTPAKPDPDPAATGITAVDPAPAAKVDPTPEPLAKPEPKPQAQVEPKQPVARPEPKKPVAVVARPQPKKPEVAVKKPVVTKPEPKKPEPKKPEPKKPTAKDLDSLPL